MKLKPWKNGRYMVVWLDGRAQKLHRVLMSRWLGRALEAWEEVDHIDGNPMNNARKNLRLATRSTNMMNQRRAGKGVRRTQSGGWQARISADKRSYCLGTFKTRIEAVAAYNAASRRLHGEFGKKTI